MQHERIDRFEPTLKNRGESTAKYYEKNKQVEWVIRLPHFTEWASSYNNAEWTNYHNKKIHVDTQKTFLNKNGVF